MLSISGCGLVTNDLLDHFERHQDIFRSRYFDPISRLTKLKTLILLTYYDADETPIQTCEEELLLRTLMGKYDVQSVSDKKDFEILVRDVVLKVPPPF